MFYLIKVKEISESKIVFENGLFAERDPSLGKDAPIMADRDLIYIISEGFFCAKKRDYPLFEDWRSWCYRDMMRHNRTAKDEDFIYSIGVAL